MAPGAGTDRGTDMATVEKDTMATVGPSWRPQEVPGDRETDMTTAEVSYGDRHGEWFSVGRCKTDIVGVGGTCGIFREHLWRPATPVNGW